jgi:phosphatidyl-myo-inositol dimannoside synthase
VKRILLITRNLPPLLGGMERLNWHMAQELASQDEVRVVAPKGAAVLAPAGVNVREVPLRPLSIFLAVACWRALCQALRWMPDIVMAGSGLTAPLAWLVGRLCRARVVVYVHGLDIVAPSLVYQSLWIPLIRRADRVIANSHSTAELARQAGVAHERIGIIHPGVDLPARENDMALASDFRLKHGLADRPLLLSVGRLTRRKGIREFVRDVLPAIVSEKPDVALVIVGDVARQALYGESQTPESIRAVAEAGGVGENVVFLGKLSESDLEGVYRASNVHVFPIRHIPGDPEGFGMVAVEAAAHGLMTVAYACGGVVDAVGEGISGYLVEPENASAFAASVLRALSVRAAPSAMLSFASRFGWSRFGDALRTELVKLDRLGDAS